MSDASGAGPVPFASVVLSACQDERVLGYTMTDALGAYQLRFIAHCDSLILTVRALGFQPQQKYLTLPDLREAYNFALPGAALQEVTIKGKYAPVVARNDTTDYNVSSFADSTEFSIEDLLKKLPGFRVSESGQITVNGKLVERVLLDGDDLFSQNYSLATRNIRADMISTVQSIDRYQENPLMKGIQASERMVLNLKIREDRKRMLSGSFTGGAGYGDKGKAYAHTNLFSLSRKDKIYLIGNANNTGIRSLADIAALNRGDIFDRQQQSLQNSTLASAELLQETPLHNVGLPGVFTQQNHTALAYYGHVIPVTAAFKIKMAAWLGQEYLDQETASKSRYFLGPDLLNLSEHREIAQKIVARRFQVEGTFFSKNAKHAIRFFAKTDANTHQNELAVERRQDGGADFHINGQATTKPLEIFGAAEYTFKINDRRLIQVLIRQDYQNHDYALNGVHHYYPLYFAIDSGFQRLSQHATQMHEKTSLAARYLGRTGDLNWEIENGVDWHKSRLYSDIELGNQTGDRWYPNSDGPFAGAFRMNTLRYFTHSKVSRTFGDFSASLQFLGAYQPLDLMPGGRKYLWSAQPGADMRYWFGEYSSLSAQYGFRQQLPLAAYLYPFYLFSDNLQLVQGFNDPSWVAKHNIRLRYSFNNRLRQFAWFVNSSFIGADNDFGMQYEINPYLSITNRFRPSASALFNVMAGVNRFFPAISSRLEFNLLHNRGDQRLKVNGDTIRLQRFKSVQMDMAYGSAFDTWVNVMLRVQMARTTSENQISPSRTLSISATNWFSTGEIIIKPISSLSIKLKAYQAIFRNNSGPYNTYHAASATARLNLPRWRSEVAFSANNLFNTHQFEQVSADVFVQSSSAVSAVARFFVLQWGFNF